MKIRFKKSADVLKYWDQGNEVNKEHEKHR